MGLLLFKEEFNNNADADADDAEWLLLFSHDDEEYKNGGIPNNNSYIKTPRDHKSAP